MWIPVLLSTIPQLIAHAAAGWFVDRFGPKPAQVVSAFILAANGVYMAYCDTLLDFVVLFTITGIGGSLLVNSWVPLLMKLAPAEHRPAYFTTVLLGAAPGSVAVAVAGILIIRYTGFDHVFWITAAGCLLAAVIFLIKLPHIRYAPVSLSTESSGKK